MRYPEGHKESVRAKIVDAASRALRRKGLTGVSVPELMKKAGLTHGGFYNHFEGKDDLVAEAVRHAGRSTAAHVFGDEVTSAREMADTYLTASHVAHPEAGCILAALGTEATHQPAPIRRAFGETARGFLAHVERKLHPDRDGEPPSNEALRLGATMVGAIVLARLVGDPALAERILTAAKPPMHLPRGER